MAMGPNPAWAGGPVPGPSSPPAAGDSRLFPGIATIPGLSPGDIAADSSLGAVVRALNTVLVDGSTVGITAPVPDALRTIPLSRWLYDADRCWGIRGEDAFESQAFSLINTLGVCRDRLERLEETIRLEGKTGSTPRPAPSVPWENLEMMRKLLLERVYWMEGLCRVEVARHLARESPGEHRSQYCFQAMEGATDDLDRAIRLRGRNTSAPAWAPPRMPVAEMEQIRRTIFGVWEAARVSGSTTGIASLRLANVLAGAEASVPQNPASRTWTELHNFDWLTGR